MSTSDPVITFEDVSFAYNGGLVLDRVNLSIAPNEFVWIVGPNGGGKTTLVKLLLGLLAPRQGKVRVFGKAPSSARPRLGYMPQHARLDPKFPVTVFDVALMGRIGAGIRLGRYNRADKKAALVALEQVGMADLRDRALDELSGGQQRRLLIARALASEPEMLVLDEPMANLDARVEEELNKLLRQLNKRHTIVMVSHDPAFVSGYVERVVCVKKQVHVHPTSTMDSQFIRELYGGPVRLVRHDVRDQEIHDDDKPGEKT